MNSNNTLDKEIKYLEIIQNIISRMANNSFMLKGWTVILISGIFTLSNKDTNKLYVLIAFIPIITFWFLDSYYLLQERLYRSLYENTILKENNYNNFSLKIDKNSFEIDKIKMKKNTYWNCLISKTETFFYLPLFFICIIIFFSTKI